MRSHFLEGEEYLHREISVVFPNLNIQEIPSLIVKIPHGRKTGFSTNNQGMGKGTDGLDRILSISRGGAIALHFFGFGGFCGLAIAGLKLIPPSEFLLSELFWNLSLSCPVFLIGFSKFLDISDDGVDDSSNL